MRSALGMLWSCAFLARVLGISSVEFLHSGHAFRHCSPAPGNSRRRAGQFLALPRRERYEDEDVEVEVAPAAGIRLCVRDSRHLFMVRIRDLKPECVFSGRNVTANYLNCVRMRTEKFANIFLARCRLLHPAPYPYPVPGPSARPFTSVSWHPGILASWHSATQFPPSSGGQKNWLCVPECCEAIFAVL